MRVPASKVSMVLDLATEHALLLVVVQPVPSFTR